jgi:hypothetical protein
VHIKAKVDGSLENGVMKISWFAITPNIADSCYSVMKIQMVNTSIPIQPI